MVKEGNRNPEAWKRCNSGLRGRSTGQLVQVSLMHTVRLVLRRGKAGNLNCPKGLLLGANHKKPVPSLSSSLAGFPYGWSPTRCQLVCWSPAPSSHRKQKQVSSLGAITDDAAMSILVYIFLMPFVHSYLGGIYLGVYLLDLIDTGSNRSGECVVVSQDFNLHISNFYWSWPSLITWISCLEWFPVRVLAHL